MPDSKPKAPALDQTQAMAKHIPGALNPAPMLVDVPVDLPPAPDLADAQTAPPAPMLTDVPIELPEIIPDPVYDDRPPADALKADWAAWAISRGVPSYEAWSMTLPELKKMWLLTPPDKTMEA